MRVGVEVGGTFTDLVAIDENGIRIAKVPSTPSQPYVGALNALDAASIDLSRVDDLVHGSTVATNAILERKGGRTAFLVTRGFRDLLLLQRHNRRRIYDLFYRKPEPVVSRRDTFEIPERIGADGAVIEALDEGFIRGELRDRLRDGDYEAIAICLLNSYASSSHERRVATLLAQTFPDVTITCSCDVTREFREFERASTTTLAGYVQPVIERYISRFERELAARRFRGRFSIMQSNGGRVPAAGMVQNVITALFSGPAAGVMGATRQAGRSGYRNLITFDMGGTSTDVCLVQDGHPTLAAETEVDGLPIRTPVLDIATVGAGGGSLVWRDDGGMLRVGPQSAGAEPGPACYERGGELPTITDAHMIRGTLRMEAFLGGKMAVNPARSTTAFEALARSFDVAIETIADDAIRVADNNIVRAIQLVSTERGRDPRDYVLVPFGGAGPLHAARVAEELGIDTLCVPAHAGVLSAYGLLASDYVRYETRTQRTAVDADAPEAVKRTFARLEAEARAALDALGLVTGIRFTHLLDMRYVGQAFEVPVELDPADLGDLTSPRLLDLFNEAHHRVFAFDDSRINAAEIISYRLGAAVSPGAVPVLLDDTVAPLDAETVIVDGGVRTACRLMNRRTVASAIRVLGPALVEDATSTAYIPAGWTARLDENHNLIMAKGNHP